MKVHSAAFINPVIIKGAPTTSVSATQYDLALAQPVEGGHGLYISDGQLHMLIPFGNIKAVVLAEPVQTEVTPPTSWHLAAAAPLRDEPEPQFIDPVTGKQYKNKAGLMGAIAAREARQKGDE